MRTLSRLFILAMVLVFLGGCATLKSVLQIEPERVEMVLLSKLAFKQFDPSGVKVPAIFGDISITHIFAGAPFCGNATAISYLAPDNKGLNFTLTVKNECPEGIALATLNTQTKAQTYWIYDNEGQAWQIDEEKYDYFLTLEHPCVVDMPEGIDATLTI